MSYSSRFETADRLGQKLAPQPLAVRSAEMMALLFQQNAVNAINLPIDMVQFGHTKLKRKLLAAAVAEIAADEITSASVLNVDQVDGATALVRAMNQVIQNKDFVDGALGGKLADGIFVEAAPTQEVAAR